MKTVFLTCGTRGAGKSTYCCKMLKNNPEICLVSRDSILIELFGQTELNPYEDGHHLTYKIMWERVGKELAGANGENFQMILDCWNGYPKERQGIIRKLRDVGADRVVAWVFTTPLETVIRWFDKANRKKGSNRKRKLERETNEHRSRHDYELFNELAADIEKDGFDEIVYINPLL